MEQLIKHQNDLYNKKTEQLRETERLILKAIEMRKLQKEFFKSKNVLILNKCKEIEAEIDKEFIEYNKKKEYNLFNQN